MQEIIEIIEYENESHRVDFKKIEFSLGKEDKKNEILKDFSSFANHLNDEDKFIIIGIKENEDKSKEVFGIDTPTDEAKYNQFITENIEPQINFEYRNFSYKGKTVCYFRLYSNYNRPYLFKKDTKKPDGKTDFKYGDGFIRIGTTTKKIGRKELDDINEAKKKYQNRQLEIDIVPFVRLSENQEVNKWNVKCLDLNIVNNSNKSIDIDIEINIKKSKGFTVLLDTDFLRELQDKENEKKQSISYLPVITAFNPIINNFHVSFSETDTQFTFERTPLNQKFAVTLKQNSVYKEIFLQSIILLQDSSNMIEAEVIIRSDDFTKGALIKNINFET